MLPTTMLPRWCLSDGLDVFPILWTLHLYFPLCNKNQYTASSLGTWMQIEHWGINTNLIPRDTGLIGLWQVDHVISWTAVRWLTIKNLSCGTVCIFWIPPLLHCPKTGGLFKIRATNPTLFIQLKPKSTLNPHSHQIKLAGVQCKNNWNMPIQTAVYIDHILW